MNYEEYNEIYLFSNETSCFLGESYPHPTLAPFLINLYMDAKDEKIQRIPSLSSLFLVLSMNNPY